MDINKIRWVAIDGSIFSEEVFTKKIDGVEIKARIAVAFNVGADVATHIVTMHNHWVWGLSA
jgi:hypothetical protein